MAQYAEYSDGCATYREGVRDCMFVIDKELTVTGFAGFEDVDWENIEQYDVSAPIPEPELIPTYYVKTGGNDALDGKSEANAWATMAKVYTEKGNFVPDDIIGFHAGDTFTQTDVANQIIEIVVSGTVGHSITYTSYGTGAKPILTAIGDITGWDTAGNWTNTSGNIWRLSWARYSYKNRIWIDGVEQTRCVNATVTLTEQVYSNGTYLYVYSAGGNPATEFTTMQCHTSDRAFVMAWEESYINISNLDIRGYNTCFDLRGCNNFNISGCKIGYDCGLYGIIISSNDGTYAQSHDIHISGNDFQTNDKIMHSFEAKNTEDAIIISDRTADVEIYNNNFYNWDHSAITIYASGVTYNIENVLIHNNYFTFEDIDYGRAFGFYINTLAQSIGCKFYKNMIYRQRNQCQLSMPNCKIFYNIFDTTYGVTYWDTFEGHAMIIGDGMPQNNYICNNIFANCVGYGLRLYDAGSGTNHVEGNYIANNILYNNTGCLYNGHGLPIYYEYYQLHIFDVAIVGANTFEYNLFYYPAITDLIYYGHDAINDYPHTIAEFNAENGTAGDVITNNLVGDPLFNTPINFMLKAGSPAINAGISTLLSAVDYIERKVANPPEIGAYEY